MFFFSFIFSSLSFAQDCDSTSLISSVQESVGDSAAQAFVELHKCDAKQANKLAESTVPKLYASDIGYEVIQIALQAGANTQVSEWLQAQLPDERKQALRYLGKACQSNASVEKFFIEQSSTLNDVFWEQGWYLPLSNCSTPGIIEMLSNGLKRENQSKAILFGVLSTYARAAKRDALPLLEEKLSKCILTLNQ